MNLTDIVCSCYSVNAEQVKNVFQFIEDIQEIQKKLKIGERCSCCKKMDCPVIDIHLNKLIELLNEENNKKDCNDNCC